MYAGGVNAARLGRDLLMKFPGRAVRSRVVLERGALARLGRFTRTLTSARHVVLVTDRRVGGLYAAAAERSLRAAGIAVDRVVVPAGEGAKRARVLERVWDALAAAGLGRDGAVVALGGGVVGDLAGFAAATWLRGVPWIGVPTTVLACVACIPCGVDHLGMPFGIQVIGPKGADAMVLEIAHSLEQVLADTAETRRPLPDLAALAS